MQKVMDYGNIENLVDAKVPHVVRAIVVHHRITHLFTPPDPVKQQQTAIRVAHARLWMEIKDHNASVNIDIPVPMLGSVQKLQMRFKQPVNAYGDPLVANKVDVYNSELWHGEERFLDNGKAATFGSFFCNSTTLEGYTDMTKLGQDVIAKRLRRRMDASNKQLLKQQQAQQLLAQQQQQARQQQARQQQAQQQQAQQQQGQQQQAQHQQGQQQQAQQPIIPELVWGLTAAMRMYMSDLSQGDAGGEAILRQVLLPIVTGFAIPSAGGNAGIEGDRAGGAGAVDGDATRHEDEQQPQPPTHNLPHGQGAAGTVPPGGNAGIGCDRASGTGAADGDAARNNVAQLPELPPRDQPRDHEDAGRVQPGSNAGTDGDTADGAGAADGDAARHEDGQQPELPPRDQPRDHEDAGRVQPGSNAGTDGDTADGAGAADGDAARHEDGQQPELPPRDQPRDHEDAGRVQPGSNAGTGGRAGPKRANNARYEGQAGVPAGKKAKKAGKSGERSKATLPKSVNQEGGAAGRQQAEENVVLGEEDNTGIQGNTDTHMDVNREVNIDEVHTLRAALAAMEEKEKERQKEEKLAKQRGLAELARLRAQNAELQAENQRLLREQQDRNRRDQEAAKAAQQKKDEQQKRALDVSENRAREAEKKADALQQELTKLQTELVRVQYSNTDARAPVRAPLGALSVNIPLAEQREASGKVNMAAQ